MNLHVCKRLTGSLPFVSAHPLCLAYAISHTFNDWPRPIINSTRLTRPPSPSPVQHVGRCYSSTAAKCAHTGSHHHRTVEPRNHHDTATSLPSGDEYYLRSVPPTKVDSYEDLLDMRRRIGDAVIVSIDMEGVHHLGPGHDPLEYLSEIGIAWLDMSSLGDQWPDCPPEEVAAKIEVDHYIVQKWGDITPLTCPSCLAQGPATRHKSHPYRGKFGYSTYVANHQRALAILRDRLASLARQANGRKIYVMFWDARLDLHTLNHAQIYPQPREQFCMWDLQLWSPIKRRYALSWRVSNDVFVRDVGLGGGVQKLDRHNAGNDAWLCLMGFIQLLRLDEPTFQEWVGSPTTDPTLTRGNALFRLKDLEFSWLDRGMAVANKKMDPVKGGKKLKAARCRLVKAHTAFHQERVAWTVPKAARSSKVIPSRVGRSS